jgi:hypothetical protein
MRSDDEHGNPIRKNFGRRTRLSGALPRRNSHPYQPACGHSPVPKPQGEEKANRNSAAIRNGRNSFMQKEKAFSNRNKNHVFQVSP